jgi:hypothetical protein
MFDIKNTDQELKIINYLKDKNNQEVAWEELVQFSKNPQTVKLKTIKKSVSEIKRKYQSSNLPIPFDVRFISLTSKSDEQTMIKGDQKLVRVGKIVALNTVKPSKPQAHYDFSLDPLGFKRVQTKYGSHQLNDNEWDMFKYFYNNVGKLVTISELRDNVVFPNYGSKLPARWFDSIMRIIGHLRKQVVGLDKRLLTVKSSETSYLFQ